MMTHTIRDFHLNEDLYLLKHPFYQAWMEGTLPRAALIDYAQQYYHHVAAFPQYLKNTMELSDCEPTRKMLAENLAEEDGSAHGTSHPELWLRFAEGVGAKRADIGAVPPCRSIQNVVEIFSAFSRQSLPEALGSLYAYEAQVPEIATSKIEGLRRHFQIHDEETLSFFEVHRFADIEHRERFASILGSLPREDLAKAQLAANSVCHALWNFLSDIHERNKACQQSFHN